jgi:hypothetical protein
VRSDGDLGPLHSPGTVKNTSLVMVFCYTHGGYLMGSMIPSSDGEDNNDVCYTDVTDQPQRQDYDR